MTLNFITVYLLFLYNILSSKVFVFIFIGRINLLKNQQGHSIPHAVWRKMNVRLNYYHIIIHQIICIDCERMIKVKTNEKCNEVGGRLSDSDYLLFIEIKMPIVENGRQIIGCDCKCEMFDIRKNVHYSHDRTFWNYLICIFDTLQ